MFGFVEGNILLSMGSLNIETLTLHKYSSILKYSKGNEDSLSSLVSSRTLCLVSNFNELDDLVINDNIVTVANPLF